MSFGASLRNLTFCCKEEKYWEEEVLAESDRVEDDSSLTKVQAFR